MGKASSSKRSRHLTDAEKARREEQHSDSFGVKRQQRKEEKMRDKRGVVVLDDPNTTFALRYDLNVPGGPLRSPYAARTAGKLVANSEADLLRDTILTLLEQFGWAKFGAAASGVIAEAINNYPFQLRQEVFRHIAAGSGLNLFVTEVTSCVDCGEQRELVSLVNTDGEDLEEQDVTVHKPGCPTHPQVDTDAIAAANEGEIDGNDPPMRSGKEADWVTGPAVMIDTPVRYRPLFAPEATPEGEAGEEAVETKPMPDGDTPVELP